MLRLSKFEQPLNSDSLMELTKLPIVRSVSFNLSLKGETEYDKTLPI